MAGKKTRELREFTGKELIRLKSDLMTQQMQLRFKAKIEKPTNPMEKRELRRTIAKINTLLREEQIKQAKNS